MKEKIDKCALRRKYLDGINLIDENFALNDFEAYMYGFLAADGTVVREGGMKLEIKDIDLLEDIAKKYERKIGKRKNRNTGIITIPAEKSRVFQNMGLCRNKSINGFEIKKMDKKSFWSFLRGLFDGDGCIRIKNNRGWSALQFRICGHPKPLGSIQKTLLEEFDIFVPWYKYSEIHGQLDTSKKSKVIEIYNNMYSEASIFLARKKEIFTKFLTEEV